MATLVYKDKKNHAPDLISLLVYPKLCDLTPRDIYFLWSDINGHVYEYKPQTIQELFCHRPILFVKFYKIYQKS